MPSKSLRQRSCAPACGRRTPQSCGTRTSDSTELHLLRAIAQATGGLRCFQGRASSNCAASEIIPASSLGRPTICRASGRPDSENPLETEMEGCPVELNGKVEENQEEMSSGTLSGTKAKVPWSGGGLVSVGVRSAS